MADNTSNNESTTKVDHSQARIIYVEPNNASGSVNNVPLTPDYTDFCISFDLIVDVISRMRANSATFKQHSKGITTDNSGDIEAMKTYVLSWTSKYDPDGKNENTNPNRVSFMTGERYGTRDYLTTYYTDTHYNDFKNKTIVEGLGVESVNISFESYYAPTVKIRFVDVRGASIFGREEVLHTDEVLAEDNIWGCFFTFPYPKYRLQVKGFYGKAVTYQLCCTDFRANLNSKNGNFEIDMSFLGYDFGLLADIPMAYLIATPYCKYADTQAYWNQQASKNENWKMSDGQSPKPFYDIRWMISQAMEQNGGFSDDRVSTEEVETAIVDEPKQALLDQMAVYIDKIKAYAEELVNDYIRNLDYAKLNYKLIETKDTYPSALPQYSIKEQDNSPHPFSSLIKPQINDVNNIKNFELHATKTYNIQDAISLTKLIEEYNEKFPESGFEPMTKDFNENFVNSYQEWYYAKDEGSAVKYGVMSWSNVRSSGLFDASYHGVTYILRQIKQILDAYETATEGMYSYGTTTVEKWRGPYQKKRIQDIAGFLPNIGNVFRTLYCHLETFAHMMYTCANNISEQKRNKDRNIQKLGLGSFDMTDINVNSVDDYQVDPFPAAYTYKNQNEDLEGLNIDGAEVNDQVAVDAWIGELPDKVVTWEEELLVENMFKAVLHTKAVNFDTQTTFSSTSYPVLPCDLNHDKIAGVGYCDRPDEMAGYLALRAASIFGVGGYSFDEAETVGMMDAIRFFESDNLKNDIKNAVIEPFGGENRADGLCNTSLCDGSFAEGNEMEFEKVPGLKALKGTNKSKRQPLFYKTNGDTLRYCYTEDKYSSGMIPTTLGNWADVTNGVYFDFEGCKTDGQGNITEGAYFNFKTDTDNKSELLYRIHSDRLTNTYQLQNSQSNNPTFDAMKYLNKEVFRVFYGDTDGDGVDVAEKVYELYENLSDGSVNVNGYVKSSDPKRFAKVLNRHWLNIDGDNFDKTYMTSLPSLYPPLSVVLPESTEKIKEAKEKLERELSNRKVLTEEEKEKLQKVKEKYKRVSVVYQNITKSDGVFKYGDNEISVEECVTLIPQLQYFTNNETKISNVFTSKIYYLQDRNSNHFSNPGETLIWSDRNTATNNMKALLFLMSLAYGNNSDLKLTFMTDDTNSRLEAVPSAMMLFLGGLLWRKRFYDKNEIDAFVNEYDGKAVFKAINKYEIPIIFTEDSKYERGFLDPKSNRSYINISSITKSDKLDLAIENELISKFEYFVSHDWEAIRKACELQKRADGQTITYKDFLEIEKSDNKEDAIKNMCDAQTARKFAYIDATADSFLSIFNLDEISDALDLVKKVYLSRVILQRSVARFSDTDGKITLKESTYKSYLNGFVKEIEEIYNSADETLLPTEDDNNDDEESDADIKRLIYGSFKNLWDRWFCGNSEDMFTVKNYMANTIFIDSMYRNVYTHLHMNCEVLYSLLTESDGQSMAFKFLSDLTTKHHCMFFALPDYLDLGDIDPKTAIKGMETLFTPYPFSKINNIATMNRYIVMFTHKPSEINENTNSYKYDSFDIYSHDSDKKSILPTFSKNPTELPEGTSQHDMECTRYGYNVPAFGISFARQNNSIFKSINVGMQNPIQTDQAINALSLIANRGRDAGERTIFYGQDLYPVYSGYSYTATIEMMGNAQIMPLMYFQLFNVPMFRGAYMIYGVTHTMRPGDMTTTVKAMKMSKRTLPWCNEWYGHYYFDNQGNIINSAEDDECSATSGTSTTLGPEQQQTVSDIKQGVINQSQLSTDAGKTKYHSLTSDARNYIEKNLTALNIRLRSTEGGDIYKWIIVNKELASTVTDIFNDIYNNTDYKFNPNQFYHYPQHGEPPLSSFTKEAGKNDSTVIGCYQFRVTKRGTMSNHAYGCAIDLNPGYNPYIGKMDDKTDSNLYIRTKHHPVVKIFAKHGWGWGGRYGDFMHFSPFNGS